MKIACDLSTTSAPMTARRVWSAAYHAPGGIAPTLVLDFARGVYGVAAGPLALTAAMSFSRGSVKSVRTPSGTLIEVAAGLPAIDCDPVTGAVLGLALHEARTNLLAVSQPTELPVVGPGRTIGLASTSLLGNPLYVTAGSGAVLLGSVTGTPPMLSAGQVFRFSCFSDQASPMQMTMSATSGYLGASVQRWTATLWRHAVVFTPTVAQVADLKLQGLAGVFGGFQLEPGAAVAPYIRTSGLGVTRSAEVAQVATSLFGFADSVGTMVIESGWDMLSANGVKLVVDRGANGRFLNSVGISVSPRSADGTTTVTPLANGVTSQALFRYATAWSGTGIAASARGNPVASGAYDGSFGTGAVLRLGAALFNGHIRSIVQYPQRLPDAVLVALTG